ncbi:MAG: tRNA (adenosine(37)-N6)-threonylcarbamoyltransferase complex transferase subunit TsaD [Chitinophagales bacterium]|nr:tRNA (adenosine(37)-N6)-threonylcarbamoyltransferase complex transferase subunit TsaD [Chitinophagales bacterium]
MSPKIIAIESSCDDTAVAVINNGKILANVVSSQTIHKQYGGIVPELASRDHIQNILPVVEEAVERSGIALSELDAVAFTRGPGLIGSLLVGAAFAKSLSLALNIPLIEVNHMVAHVLAHFIDDPKPEFPFICLTVSGGHTQLILVRDHLDMEIVGQTRDDAAGEAFDKSAKLLGLEYPGGPLIDKYAAQGDPYSFEFPEPDIGGLDFSFSGLKTSILRTVQKMKKEDPDSIDNNLEDLSASIQHVIVTILLKKMTTAGKKFDVDQFAIAGGVSANSGLRSRFEALGKERGWKTFIPKFEYCTDNAAMIAITAHYKYKASQFASLDTKPSARLKFEA